MHDSGILACTSNSMDQGCQLRFCPSWSEQKKKKKGCSPDLSTGQAVPWVLCSVLGPSVREGY